MRYALAAVTLLLSQSANAAETITYTYDVLGRLTAATSTGSVNSGVNRSTSYDPAGNRTNESVNGALALRREQKRFVARSRTAPSPIVTSLAR